MKKIKLFPAPHLELKVYVSDEMLKDYIACARGAEHAECEGKDCDGCSWNAVRIGDLNMCELDEMEMILKATGMEK